MVVLLAVLLGVGLAGYRLMRWWPNVTRMVDLQGWALSRDYDYTDEVAGLQGLYPYLPGMQDYRRPRCTNVIRGRLDGLPLTGFDLARETSKRGDSSTAVPKLQVLAVEFPQTLPTLTVRRHDLLDRLATSVGGQDVVIGQDEFDKVFRVVADDERAVRRLLLPIAPTLLARTDQALQTNGSTLLVLRRGALSVDDLDEWIADLKTILSLVPRA